MDVEELGVGVVAVVGRVAVDRRRGGGHQRVVAGRVGEQPLHLETGRQPLGQVQFCGPTGGEKGQQWPTGTPSSRNPPSIFSGRLVSTRSIRPLTGTMTSLPDPALRWRMGKRGVKAAFCFWNMGRSRSSSSFRNAVVPASNESTRSHVSRMFEGSLCGLLSAERRFAFSSQQTNMNTCWLAFSY